MRWPASFSFMPRCVCAADNQLCGDSLFRQHFQQCGAGRRKQAYHPVSEQCAACRAAGSRCQGSERRHHRRQPPPDSGISAGEFRRLPVVSSGRRCRKEFHFDPKTPLRAGKLRLTAERTASFLTFEAGGRNLIFVNVNFAGLTGSEEKTVFGNLAEFVLSQDEPLIIVGDFGIPPGRKLFGRFWLRPDWKSKPHHHERRQQQVQPVYGAQRQCSGLSQPRVGKY